MILQALVDYYDRKAALEETALPLLGWERRRIPFIIEIRPDGSFVQIVDTRKQEGSRLIAQEFLVPQAPKRSVNVAASLLWDSAEYVLGVPIRNSAARAEKAHGAFTAAITDALGADPQDPAVAAAVRFLDKVPLDDIASDPRWSDLTADNPFVALRLAGESELACRCPSVQKWIGRGGGATDGRCLVTGNTAKVARLHPSLKGIRGANTSGASLVGFNLAAFESYGRTQGFNAPVGEVAAFKYTTALNDLLRPDSTQKQTIANTTFVYWAERQDDEGIQDAIALLFGDPVRDDPDRNASVVRDVLASVRSSVRAREESGRFFVLGLAPNAARISVRSWLVASARDVGERITQHFDDIEIVRPPKSHPFATLYRLLRATAALAKADNIPPVLEGEVVRAILDGRPYPTSLLAAAVGRARAEQDVTPDRAALIKAVLNRARRAAGETREGLTVALDSANPDPGYRLGRLFAALERAQEMASPGLNATIRDRFYGAASSTPIAVFPRLLGLKNHHVAKLESVGLRTWIEKLIGEIVDGIPAIPAHLSLEQQGAFAVGYYHQRRDFYKKHATENGESN